MDARVARRRVGRLRIGEDESQCDRVEGRTYDTLEVSLGGAPELEDAGASAARGLHAVRRGPLPLGEGGAAASGLTRRVRVSGLDAHLRPSPDAPFGAPVFIEAAPCRACAARPRGRGFRTLDARQPGRRGAAN